MLNTKYKILYTDMKLIKHTCGSPEENVALDELLLMKAEDGYIGETMRLWSSEEYFVVLGRACKYEEDCYSAKCKEQGVRIIRRISGGGTVLQGPGCLNYSLVLSYDDRSEYKDVNTSYREILGRLADGLGKKMKGLEFLPISDLAVSGKKISGNAQARKKKFFLHHGTILFAMDTAKIAEYLKYPPKEPEYRKGRDHDDFVTNSPLDADELEHLIIGTFGVPDVAVELSEKNVKGLKGLVDAKYSQDSWNLMF